MSETFTSNFFLEVCEISKTGPDSQFGAWWLSMGGKGALNYLPIVPKASIYVPKVIIPKSVMGGNTVPETFTSNFLSWSVWSFKNWPDSHFGAWWLSMGGKGVICNCWHSIIWYICCSWNSCFCASSKITQRLFIRRTWKIITAIKVPMNNHYYIVDCSMQDCRSGCCWIRWHCSITQISGWYVAAPPSSG